MNLLKHPTRDKWVENKENSQWNRIFSSLEQRDILITKCMAYYCVTFADNLLHSEMFESENMAIRAETILIAKMQFYHLVTKSQTIHNLFYGYMYELYVNHYESDIETAYLFLDIMHKMEKWYLTYYYEFYENMTGNFKKVFQHYCENVERNNCNEKPILKVDAEAFSERAADLLMKMQVDFMCEMPRG